MCFPSTVLYSIGPSGFFWENLAFFLLPFDTEETFWVPFLSGITKVNFSSQKIHILLEGPLLIRPSQRDGFFKIRIRANIRFKIMNFRRFIHPKPIVVLDLFHLFVSRHMRIDVVFKLKSLWITTIVCGGKNTHGRVLSPLLEVITFKEHFELKKADCPSLDVS